MQRYCNLHARHVPHTAGPFTDNFVVQMLHSDWCVCLSVFERCLPNEMTFNLDIWHDGSKFKVTGGKSSFFGRRCKNKLGKTSSVEEKTFSRKSKSVTSVAKWSMRPRLGAFLVTYFCCNYGKRWPIFIARRHRTAVQSATLQLFVYSCAAVEKILTDAEGRYLWSLSLAPVS